MDLLQTIFSNNRLVLDAVEQAEPVLRRLAGRVGECLRAGGHIVLIGGKSPVIGEYASETDIYADEPGLKDIVIALDGGSDAALAEQLRTWRRRGVATACISGQTASPAVSAAEIAVILKVECAEESRRLKVAQAQQLALDAALTLGLNASGLCDGPAEAAAKDAFLERAAASLMKELPALDRESAIELIQRHGTVRKAAKAYLDNVQAKL